MLSIEGAITISNGMYEVEYEPSQLAGSGTMFLRIINSKYNLPIYKTNLDDVVDLLTRMKAAIEALEEETK